MKNEKIILALISVFILSIIGCANNYGIDDTDIDIAQTGNTETSGNALEIFLDEEEEQDDSQEIKESEEIDDTEETEETEEETTVVTFDFLDVYGESYTAELLEDIPMHEYDYSRLDNENKLYTYSNEDGEITSKVGIDVSKYQGDIDWQAVAAEGIEFVIIRLGYRGYGSEGNLGMDEYFQDNVSGALEAGLEVGVYFFSQAITDEEALEEAEFVLEAIKDYDITMPVVFDTEIVEVEGARTLEVDKEIFTSACIVFCDRILEEGYETMIYFNLVWSAFTLDLEQLVDYEKWYADYYDIPQYPYAFEMWQYTESATINGIQGYVDLNLYFNISD